MFYFRPLKMVGFFDKFLLTILGFKVLDVQIIVFSEIQ